MRITYLHQYFNTPAMSGGTRSYEMARRLVDMGHEVDLITTRRDGISVDGWQVTNEAGIRVHWISIPYSNRMGYGLRILAFFKFAIFAARRAASIQSDLIFATSTPLTIALPAVWASWCRNVPMVLEVRDLWPKVPIALGALSNPLVRYAAIFLERFAYRQSAAVVALSPDMRDGVTQVGYPAGKVTVIPNACDLDLFYPDPVVGAEYRRKHDIPQHRTLMVYAGTLGLVNGVGYVVKLAAAMKLDPRAYFLIVGDGGEAGLINEMAQTSGCLGVNLKILSTVPKKEISAVFAAADISISTVIPVPALEANSANKVFDGMAAGCCIAINHGGWLATLLNETKAGMVLPQDIPAAALELTRWLDNPALISSARVHARELAEQRFSRDTLAFELNSLLKRVVNNQMESNE